MKVVFLGTSGSMPTPERSSSAVAVRRKGEVILFDCGEGTQRQMLGARIGFRRPMRIFLTHLHGDHVLGLPGLLQTMTLLRRERPLDIYGPRGTLNYIQAFTDALGGPTFPAKVYEIMEDGVIVDRPEYDIVAVRSDHDIEGWSYALIEHPRPGRFHPEKAKALGVPEGGLWGRLQHGEDVELEDGRVVHPRQVVDPPRPGRKIVYSGDTRPSDDLVRLAEGADLLIHEATFDESLEERAGEDGHTTASQAAMLASKAGVGRLVLTHISSRYPDPSPLLEQARKVFPRTMVAHDLMEIELPLRG